jgi:hypothetical protein
MFNKCVAPDYAGGPDDEPPPGPQERQYLLNDVHYNRAEQLACQEK